MHASICDLLADIVQNSIEADASLIRISFIQTDDKLSVKVLDDGKGMDELQQIRALDPFYTDGHKHAARKVGLGLPFLKQMVDMTDGTCTLRSERGKGTDVSFTIDLSHIDAPPVGDIAMTLTGLFSYPSDSEIIFRRAFSRGGEGDEYEVEKSGLLDVLGELNTVGNLLLVKEYMQSQEAAIEEVHHRVR
ncbi:MAG: sensor histidine kinase [Sphaerochaetaceae bacterium]|nr:sensor histidine kinase [Sphaerochaetaceae bacterium]